MAGPKIALCFDVYLSLCTVCAFALIICTILHVCFILSLARFISFLFRKVDSPVFMKDAPRVRSHKVC